MRGHWLSTTRKLNRHYQSGVMSSGLRVIRTGDIVNTINGYNGPMPDGMSITGLLGDWGANVDPEDPTTWPDGYCNHVYEIVYDAGWYGFKWELTDVYVKDYFNQTDRQPNQNEFIGIENASIYKMYPSTGDRYFMWVGAAQRDIANLGTQYYQNVNSEFTPDMEVYNGGRFYVIPIDSGSNYGMSNYTSQNIITTDYNDNTKHYSGGFYFYISPTYISQYGPNDLITFFNTFQYNNDGYSTFFGKGRSYIEKYNKSPFEV